MNANTLSHNRWVKANKTKVLVYQQKSYHKHRTKNLLAQTNWRNKNRDYARKWEYQKKFGISLADYENILQQQRGVCAICLQPETFRIKGRIIRLAVDHNHVTEMVRGLLCRACNLGLGLMGDSAQRLRQAAHYLDTEPQPMV